MRFVLSHRTARHRASTACLASENEGKEVVIKDVTRNAEQNAKFHAMVDDVSRQCMWLGKKWSAPQWKVLLISGHAVATKQGAEMIPGLEGEFVNVREESSRMSIKRAASLITYVQAWGDNEGVSWSDPKIAEEYA